MSADTASTSTPKTPAAEQPDPAGGAGADHFAWQFWVTIALLVGFAILIVVLMVNAKDATETEWTRRVYLYGSVEAIVFTSVGWLFGREVHRGEAKAAKDDAKDAKDDAKKAKDDADAAKDTAMAKTEEAAVLRAKGEATRALVRGGGGAAPRDQPAARGTVTGTADPVQRALEDLWGD